MSDFFVSYAYAYIDKGPFYGWALSILVSEKGPLAAKSFSFADFYVCNAVGDLASYGKF